MTHRAAYLGPPGTFSHEAALTFFPDGVELVPGRTASEVMRFYREGTTGQALLAIDTSVCGTVGANLDEIAKLDPVRIIGETLIAVHHQLVARPEVRIPAVTTVLAHPKAFEECAHWLARHLPNALRAPLPSSAAAAEQAVAEASGKTAAIASKTAADLYRLKILAADIENSPMNTTRFWAFGREIPPPTGHDQTTLLVTGDLNAALAALVNAKMEILSIYERSSGGKIDARFYFLDLAGHVAAPLLSRLLRRFPEGRWLGSYPRA